MSKNLWRISLGAGLLAVSATLAAQDNPRSTATKPAPRPTASPTGVEPQATPSATVPARPRLSGGTQSTPATVPTPMPSATKPAATAATTTTKPTAPAPAATSPAAVQKPAVKPVPSALSKQIRDAKGKAAPVAAAELDAARRTLQRAMAELESYFVRMGENGPGWKQYLHWDALAAEVAKPANYDTALLLKLQRRFGGGFVGLEESEFVAVADALLAFAHRAEAVQNPNLAADTDAHLEKLADAVETADDEQAQKIGEELAWLERNGQATSIVVAVREVHSRPNLFVDVSGQFVADALSRPIDEVEPVRDCILGTNISGTGHTVGTFAAQLVDNPSQGQIVAHLEAVNHSKTVGRNRSALIYSSGVTQLAGDTNLTFDEHGITAGNITADARVNTTFNGFGSTRGRILGRIVTKAAARKAPKQKAQGEAIAAQHAEARLIGKMRAQIVDLVEQSNDRLATQFRLPLERFRQYPRDLQFSSTPEALRIRAVQDSAGRVAAPSAPPQPASDAVVSVRMHASLIGNSTQGMLAGRKFDQTRIQLLAESILGEVPPRLQPNPDEEPFSITFADQDPVTIELDDDVLSFTVRGKAYTSSDKEYDGMNVTGRYKLETDGRTLKAARVGEFEIFPPEFVSGGTQRLSVRQTVLKSILERKFGKAFPTEIVRENVKLEGELAKLGTLGFSRAKAEDGWLTVELRRSAERTAATAAVDQ